MTERRLRPAGPLALLAGLLIAGLTFALPGLAQNRPKAGAPAAAPAVVAPKPAAPAPAPVCPPAVAPYTPQELEDGQRLARNRGFLFEVKKDGRRSYLYGTTHIGRRDWVFLGPMVVEALGSVDQVALELDLGDADVLQRLQAGVRRRPDTPALPAALEQRLRAARQAACAEDLADLRPEFQAISLAGMALRRDGLEPAYAIDPAVAEFAAALGKPVFGLESPEEQIALLTREDASGVADVVASTLEELARPQTRSALLRLMVAWDESDVRTLLGYERWCDCLNSPVERQEWATMLERRNPAMVEQLVRLHESGETLFMAVGALHLVGERGLPALLEGLGFEVRRVLYPRQ
jgi:hypothetical protein